MRAGPRSKRLEELYRRIAALTQPECARCQPVPFSCCHANYCYAAIAYAQQDCGVVLAETGHPTLPLMGDTGCTAPPHLRPVCAVHTCEVNAFGFKRGDEAWTKRYFILRVEIDRLEWEEVGERRGATT